MTSVTTPPPPPVGQPPTGHAVVRFTASLSCALDRLAEVPTWSMTPAEQRAALVDLRKLQSRLKELELRVLVQADRDDVGVDSGAVSTPAWLAHATRTSTASRQRDLHLAAKLDDRFTATRQAFAAGAIDLEKAGIVVGAVEALSADFDDLPPGRGDGTSEGRFTLPTLHAHLLRKALEVLTRPRRLGDGRVDPESGKKLAHGTLLGQGLIDLLENHLSGLPSVHGSPFTLVVTIGVDALRSGLGVAGLDTGHRISAGEARPAATGRRPGSSSITRTPGAGSGRRMSRTASPCARRTTGWPTTRRPTT